MLVLGVFGIIFTNRMQQNTHRILEENVSSLKAAEELEIALLDMKGFTANYLLDGQQYWLVEFTDKQASFIKWLNDAQKITHTLEEEKILDEIHVLFQNYINYQRQVVLHSQQGNNQKAHDILTEQMRDTFNLIYEKCEELLFINEKLMYNTSLLIEKDNITFNRLMYGIGITGILLGLALGLLLARSITHPIYELVLKVKGATHNGIVEKVNIANETELEHLDKYVRNLIEKINEVNKDLERSQQMLIRSEKLAALGKMAAGLAHEIRNPLTAVKMLIFSLQNEVTGDSQLSNDFAVIVKEIDRIENFIQNFLDFARPPKPNFSFTDVNETVKQTLNLLSPQIKNAKLELVENLNTSGVMVYSDREQLKQVLVNIIMNAIQTMPTGGKLNVATSTDGESQDLSTYLKIKISDTGTGISHEMLDSIFDPFVTSKEDGVGLGLSIAHQIIANHGGWIEATNNKDKGATFIINLPLRKKEK